MINAWWLFLIIPASIALGVMIFIGWIMCLDWRDAHDSSKKKRF